MILWFNMEGKRIIEACIFLYENNALPLITFEDLELGLGLYEFCPMLFETEKREEVYKALKKEKEEKLASTLNMLVQEMGIFRGLLKD